MGSTTGMCHCNRQGPPTTVPALSLLAMHYTGWVLSASLVLLEDSYQAILEINHIINYIKSLVLHVPHITYVRHVEVLKKVINLKIK